MNRTVFKPLEQFPLSRIVPTEDDDYFRHQLVHGYVHDPAAAMLGGVAGHAGLFSTTHDFAKLMQMLLNEGAYGGKRYFDPATVQLFTSQQYEDNRKGLGFDKPEPDTSKVSPTGELASLQTFGHTGFTGTCIWADPKHDLIYGFFSNRVHPDADNEKLISMDFRTIIQDAIYRSFLDKNAIEKRQGQTVQ
jgi:CubicO group peptidase (beta-lactamase class C family)